jgi:hypothetical protein
MIEKKETKKIIFNGMSFFNYSHISSQEDSQKKVYFPFGMILIGKLTSNIPFSL